MTGLFHFKQGKNKMSIFKQFATDANKETEGVKIEYGANKDGSIPSVTVRRLGKSNKRYSKALEVATRPHKRAIELQTLPEETAEKIFKSVFAETVVVGWENIQPKDDGVNMPFTKANALLVFDTIPEFYDDLQEQSKKISLFRNESMEDDAKN